MLNGLARRGAGGTWCSVPVVGDATLEFHPEEVACLYGLLARHAAGADAGRADG